MTSLRLRLRHAFAGALAVCLLALGATDAQATHFRYGTLRWEKVSEDATNVTIKITSESAWRFSYPAWPSTPTLGVPMTVGQTLVVQRISGGGAVFSTPLVITPSAINGPEDWFVGSSLNTVTFAKVNLPVRIFWQGNARISSLQDGNNDRSFRVESIMSATPNAASPAASILPIITVAYPLPAAHFFIPAADVEGDTLTWSISPLSRSLLVKAAPDGLDNVPPPTLSIDSATGEVTWATNEELSPTPGGHFYAVQFLVTDSKGAEAPVDALLRLIPNAGTAPEARINGSLGEHLVSVRPNNPVSFTLTGIDVDPGATVTLSSGSLPPGATMTPSLPTSGAGNAPGTSSVFNWTPTLAQAGNVFVVSFAVTDNFGIQDTNSARITVLENFAPTVACPLPVTVEATGPSGASATIEATVEDPDGDALTVRWFVGGVLVETDLVPANAGSTVVSLTHSYGFGANAVRVEADDGQLTRECTSSVEVVDTTAPTLHLPASQVLEATGPGGAQAFWTPDPPEATDIVDGTILATCSAASGDVFPIATNTVNCSATDAHGNTATGSFTITVVDTTAPVLTLPADITEEATSPAGDVVTFVATAVDIVDGNVPVTCVPPSGSTFPLGATTVNCSATDSHNNTATGSFIVTVVDTTPPVLTLPADITEEATSPAGDVVTFVATAVDIVDGNVPVTCVPPSGSTFPLGATTVNCSATDSHNNTASGSFVITVVDTTPPTIHNMPPDMTVESTSPGGAIVTWPPPNATDIVDVTVPVFCVPASGSLFPLGSTVVTCTATDAHGNAASASFTVTVIDAIPPVVTVTLNPGVLWPPNHKMVNIRVTVTTSDTDPNPVCRITNVTSSEPVDGDGDGSTPFDWLFSGLSLQLRAERSGTGPHGSVGRIYTVTVACTDVDGNTGTGTATAVVPHDMRGSR